MPDAAWLWQDTGAVARAARVGLLPFAAMFRAATTLRGAAYDSGAFGAKTLSLPAVSVGNLTVGGTGKTPVSNWIAAQLVERGAHPAILLRGYGSDEPAVHARLLPSAIVIADADRARGADAACARGADCAVLDDAFQHRRVARLADIVLVSADAWSAARWPLPAGPWREPLRALRRARVVAITRKVAGDSRVADVERAILRAAPASRIAVIALSPDSLVRWSDRAAASLGTLRDRRILAISAIGDPRAFEDALAAVGGGIERARFPDHHVFSDSDVREMVVRSGHSDVTVCTLKDAVKIGARWPVSGPPLWYLSQRVNVERGAEMIAAVIDEVLGARRGAGREEMSRPHS